MAAVCAQLLLLWPALGGQSLKTLRPLVGRLRGLVDWGPAAATQMNPVNMTKKDTRM